MSLDATPLANKTAVVLGGTGGIGLAVAQLIAEAGAAVAVVASRDLTKAQRLAVNLVGKGHHGYASQSRMRVNSPHLHRPSKSIWAVRTSW